MASLATCPNCGKRFEFGSQHSGKTVKCPCGNAFKLPAIASSVPNSQGAKKQSRQSGFVLECNGCQKKHRVQPHQVGQLLSCDCGFQIIITDPGTTLPAMKSNVPVATTSSSTVRPAKTAAPPKQTSKREHENQLLAQHLHDTSYRQPTPGDRSDVSAGTYLIGIVVFVAALVVLQIVRSMGEFELGMGGVVSCAVLAVAAAFALRFLRKNVF